MNNDVYIIIPSRIGSTRLKNKPLIDLKGRSLIQRVLINALNISKNSFVATDSNLISKNVNNISNNILMTSKNHISGTDRIYEAATQLNLSKDTLIINLQGDEPFLPKALIDNIINDYNKNTCDVITASNKINKQEELANPNCVLVETDDKNYATKFVRVGDVHDPERHIGIYGYSLKVLEEFVNLKPTKSELSLKLEQLRFLENNYSIYVTKYNDEIPNGIDTQDDIEKAVKYLS
ncbi:MAG: 3-deoxy-manno-octulosonate cytidylyltransferase [Gammaproteobacteria bacterium]